MQTVHWERYETYYGWCWEGYIIFPKYNMRKRIYDNGQIWYKFETTGTDRYEFSEHIFQWCPNCNREMPNKWCDCENACNCCCDYCNKLS